MQDESGQFLGTYTTLYVGEVITIVEVSRPAEIAGDTENALC